MQVSKGNQNDAIKNAIIDFLHSDRFIKGDSVFSISTKNISEDILGVSISREGNKISVITQNEIDYNYKAAKKISFDSIISVGNCRNFCLQDHFFKTKK